MCSSLIYFFFHSHRHRRALHSFPTRRSSDLIYRRRPYYFILEFITRNAIARGLVEDTVAEDLVRTGCHIAQADGPQWPDRGRDFMTANFIDLGRLRASGQWLRPDGSFTIAIPGDYVV